MIQNDIDRKASSYAISRYPNIALTGFTDVDLQNAARNGYIAGVDEYREAVWHTSADDTPADSTETVIAQYHDHWCSFSACTLQQKDIRDYVVQWAYLSDLLPKGGEG